MPYVLYSPCASAALSWEQRTSTNAMELAMLTKKLEFFDMVLTGRPTLCKMLRTPTDSRAELSSTDHLRK